MQRSLSIAHNVPASASVVTSPPTHRQLLYTRLVLITSSAVQNIPVAEIKSSSRDTPPLVSMVVPLSRGASPKIRWMVSAKSSPMQVVDSPHTHIHASCLSSGNSPLSRWDLDHLMQSIKRALIATYTIEALKIRANNESGHFSVMVKLMNQRASAHLHSHRAKN